MSKKKFQCNECGANCKISFVPDEINNSVVGCIHSNDESKGLWEEIPKKEKHLISYEGIKYKRMKIKEGKNFKCDAPSKFCTGICMPQHSGCKKFLQESRVKCLKRNSNAHPV